MSPPTLDRRVRLDVLPRIAHDLACRLGEAAAERVDRRGPERGHMAPDLPAQLTAESSAEVIAQPDPAREGVPDPRPELGSVDIADRELDGGSVRRGHPLGERRRLAPVVDGEVA